MSKESNFKGSFSSQVELSGLIDQARRGNQDALGRIFELLRPFLLQIANEELDPKLRQKIGGSDIVQQTLFEAGQAIVSFDGDSPVAFIAWVRRILLNNIANSRRHFKTEMRNINREIRLSGEGSSAVTLAEVAVTDLGKSDFLRKQEMIALVASAIESLTCDQQQVILYRSQQKRSFIEIGVLMNRSEDAARKLWARAIEALKMKIDSLEKQN